MAAALTPFCSAICTENIFAPTTWCNIFGILENSPERAMKQQERAIRSPERGKYDPRRLNIRDRKRKYP